MRDEVAQGNDMEALMLDMRFLIDEIELEAERIERLISQYEDGKYCSEGSARLTVQQLILIRDSLMKIGE